MNSVFTDRASESLENLDSEISRRILDFIDEVTEEGFSHERVKMIKDRNGDWVYRIKIKEDGLNYRTFMDYVDGEFKILDILHRDEAYEGVYGENQ